MFLNKTTILIISIVLKIHKCQIKEKNVTTKLFVDVFYEHFYNNGCEYSSGL